MSGLWVLVDLDWLLCLTALLFFLFACWVCVVAAEFANQIYDSGSGVEISASGDVAVTLGAGIWATGPSTPITGAGQSERDTQPVRRALGSDDAAGGPTP